MEKRNSVIRIQDKGNNFVFLNSELDQSKLKEQMDRSSFEVLSEDPSQKTIVEIDKWVDGSLGDYQISGLNLLLRTPMLTQV